MRSFREFRYFFGQEYIALKVVLAIFLIFQKLKDLESDEIYFRFNLTPGI